MNSEINIEEIRNYLEGKLTSEELAAFDSRIQSDPNLASEVDMQREIRKTVRISGMKSDLEMAHSEWVRSQGSEMKQLVSQKRRVAIFGRSLLLRVSSLRSRCLHYGKYSLLYQNKPWPWNI